MYEFIRVSLTTKTYEVFNEVLWISRSDLTLSQTAVKSPKLNFDKNTWQLFWKLCELYIFCTIQENSELLSCNDYIFRVFCPDRVCPQFLPLPLAKRLVLPRLIQIGVFFMWMLLSITPLNTKVHFTRLRICSVEW